MISIYDCITALNTKADGYSTGSTYRDGQVEGDTS